MIFKTIQLRMRKNFKFTVINIIDFFQNEPVTRRGLRRSNRKRKITPEEGQLVEKKKKPQKKIKKVRIYIAHL